jgi:hypothetical protein
LVYIGSMALLNALETGMAHLGGNDCAAASGQLNHAMAMTPSAGRSILGALPVLFGPFSISQSLRLSSVNEILASMLQLVLVLELIGLGVPISR